MAMAMGRRARRRARRHAAAGREAEITLAMLSSDLQLKIFSELDPGDAVAFSSASSELRALTQAEWQQLRAGYHLQTISKLLFDTGVYAEGRDKVAAITATWKLRRPPWLLPPAQRYASPWNFGPWMRARVLLWEDHEGGLHVTVAKTVSQRVIRAPRAAPTHHVRASRHRLQEEPPLHLSVATHNFVERGDSEVEVVVGEVWSRCGRGAVEQQTEVCNFRCSALRDLFMQSLRDGALSLPARGLRQGRRRRPPACPLPAPHVATSLRNGDDRRLTPRFLPCTEDLRIILRGRIMTPLPPGMLVELVKHVKKEQGWASTVSSLLTNLWAHLRAYLWGLGLRGGGL